MKNTEEQEYQEFKLKLLKSIKDLKDDVEKLSEVDKQRFKNDIRSLLIAEIPNIVEFIKTNF